MEHKDVMINKNMTIAQKIQHHFGNGIKMEQILGNVMIVQKVLLVAKFMKKAYPVEKNTI